MIFAMGDGASVGVMARNPPSDWRRPWLGQTDLFIGSAGDPTVYCVDGAEVALRKETAQYISVHSVCKAERKAAR